MPLKNYIKNKPSRMATLKYFSQAIRPDDWSITVDLKYAFCTPNTPRVSPLSSLPVGRKGVSILAYPIQVNIITSGIHRHNQTIDGKVPSEGNTCHLLPSRHPGAGRRPSTETYCCFDFTVQASGGVQRNADLLQHRPFLTWG